MNYMRQVGLLDAWHRQFWPQPNKCSNPLDGNKSPDSSDINSMTLEQLVGSFFLFCMGMAISFLAFLGERLYYAIRLL